jgi:hypothetical protein
MVSAEQVSEEACHYLLQASEVVNRFEQRNYIEIAFDPAT